jgi:hypothetical protein
MHAKIPTGYTWLIYGLMLHKKGQAYSSNIVPFHKTFNTNQIQLDLLNPKVSHFLYFPFHAI